ncbi:hypothetical protein CHU93_03615 [Sandarakinorhabdus cyanobacteriorum]|uniref:Uncharacterized protein n=1 Tax=Sandarakinorhabdus cyanobacteriorum TaxID=1981098 RepID=A0A255YSM8_9SPHN|nr:hypothetical protein CHU93_03615 [Sandarakinorhabdus cyanobacteriorum]
MEVPTLLSCRAFSGLAVITIGGLATLVAAGGGDPTPSAGCAITGIAGASSSQSAAAFLVRRMITPLGRQAPMAGLVPVSTRMPKLGKQNIAMMNTAAKTNGAAGFPAAPHCHPVAKGRCLVSARPDLDRGHQRFCANDEAMRHWITSFQLVEQGPQCQRKWP